MTGCESGGDWQVLIAGLAVMGALFLGTALLVWVTGR